SRAPVRRDFDLRQFAIAFENRHAAWNLKPFQPLREIGRYHMACGAKPRRLAFRSPSFSSAVSGRGKSGNSRKRKAETGTGNCGNAKSGLGKSGNVRKRKAGTGTGNCGNAKGGLG